MIQSALLVMLAWLIVNGVDRVMSWQTFARPIVTAAITGLVLGDLTTGVVMGASLEAIFHGDFRNRRFGAGGCVFGFDHCRGDDDSDRR